MKFFKQTPSLVKGLTLFLAALICIITFNSYGAVSQTLPRDLVTYRPAEITRLAHSTNFGKRSEEDIYGNRVSNDLIAVIHETVISAADTVRIFQTPHYNESDQASYHDLIARDGTIIHLVLIVNRAFGAGNSVFMGANGPEAVRTHPVYPASVNNFAYHISLETPRDGNHNGNSHSGYSQQQYQSLALLISRKGIPANRITTHKAVDRSASRKDPRSFNNQYFARLMNLYSQLDPAIFSMPAVDKTVVPRPRQSV
ncbi:MAG: N-acetylmuramoyl-L-alanine amidase [Acaryochloridaceae cyanobacterium SU_2_1]|nr:N-acetylmuramoyl-L-alanine amidase [Acaryochloridaceae cyanobacterium SU_2_1]